jgi:hypothetical protein
MCSVLFCLLLRQFSNAILMADKMSCSNDLDSCYCRADLMPSGLEYLSQCVYSACTSDTVDVTSAINLYSSYCSNTGEPFIGASTTISTGAFATSKSGLAATTQTIPLSRYITVTQTKVLLGSTAAASRKEMPGSWIYTTSWWNSWSLLMIIITGALLLYTSHI